MHTYIYTRTLTCCSRDFPRLCDQRIPLMALMTQWPRRGTDGRAVGHSQLVNEQRLRERVPRRCLRHEWFPTLTGRCYRRWLRRPLNYGPLRLDPPTRGSPLTPRFHALSQASDAAANSSRNRLRRPSVVGCALCRRHPASSRSAVADFCYCWCGR